MARKQYPAETILDVDYIDDLVLLANIPTLKLVDQFTYLNSNISSTENDVNIHIGKP